MKTISILSLGPWSQKRNAKLNLNVFPQKNFKENIEEYQRKYCQNLDVSKIWGMQSFYSVQWLEFTFHFHILHFLTWSKGQMSIIPILLAPTRALCIRDDGLHDTFFSLRFWVFAAVESKRCFYEKMTFTHWWLTLIYIDKWLLMTY